MTSFVVRAVAGIGEVVPGTDLAALVLDHAALADGDLVVVTSKVVSKAEGRVVRAAKGAALAAETARVVARRGATSIVRTRHGLVMAAAGVDASNVEPGMLVLLPVDPDGSARLLREGLRDRGGVDVAVVVSDTSGRAWRHGQTDIAIGAAGLAVLLDHAGRTDSYGNLLSVTAPAVADEVAGAADLAKGKLSRTPVAVVRGLSHLVLPAGQHGPGAGALVRGEASDMFGYGARDAVVHAVLADDDGRGFGATASSDALEEALSRLLSGRGRLDSGPGRVALTVLETEPRAAGRLEAQAETVARAHGWRPVQGPEGDLTGFRPCHP